MPEGDQERLDRALTAWCAAAGASAAAVYCRHEGMLQRAAVYGSGPFPQELREPQHEEWTTRQLAADCWLLAPPSAREPAPAEDAILAAAARARLLAEELRRQRFAARYQGVELQALYDVGLAIASTLEVDLLAPEILAHAVSLVDARRGVLYLLEGETYVATSTLGGPAESPLAADHSALRPWLEGTGGDAAAAGLLPGASHGIGVAVGAGEAPRGLLMVADKESRSGVGPFGESDLRTLKLLATQAGIALETADLHAQALVRRGLERELSLASEIQARLLPAAPPTVAGYEIAGWSRPARQVGGDYYDLVPLDQDSLAVVLGDVAGKGMPAALMVSTLHAALRLLIEASPPEELLGRVNEYLVQSSAPSHYATLFLAVLEPATGRLRYWNAGHNPGIVMAPDGRWRRLDSVGLPIGMLQGRGWQAAETQMAAGELLALYSDGLTEANAADGEEYGLDRLADLLAGLRTAALPEILDRARMAMDTWAEGIAQSDDQTLLLLRRS